MRRLRVAAAALLVLATLPWLTYAAVVFAFRIGVYQEDAGACTSGAPLLAVSQAAVAVAGSVLAWRAAADLLPERRRAVGGRAAAAVALGLVWLPLAWWTLEAGARTACPGG